MQRVAAAVGEHGAHAGAVTFPRALELGQRLEARPPHRQLDPGVSELRLGVGQPPLSLSLLGLQQLAPLLERDELGRGTITRGGERASLAQEALGLGLGLGELAGQPLGAPGQLRLAFTQLTGAAHEIDALGGEPRLLQAECLGMIALDRERGALALQGRLELRRGARALGGDLLGIAERQPDVLPLDDDRRLPLGGRADFLVEPDALLAELADLHAHLLAALEEPLELALHLRHGLPQVRESMLARLQGFPRLGLVRGQGRQARAQPVLAVAQTRQLARQPLALALEPGVVRGDQGQPELALLGLERLVLLGLLGLALERVQLPAHLVHDIAHPDQVLAGCVELGLGLVALLLVARDSRRFLDEHAALVRLRGQDVVELVLVHDRIGPRVRAGAGEEVQDVAQARRALVQEVFALARPVEPAADGHFGPRHRERAVVTEDQFDLGEADRLARGRAVEDEIFHLLAAERLRALLAEGPADRFRDVALAAPVRPDDRGDPGHDLQDALFRERFEAVQRDGFEAHGVF